jgi:signal transduction histidine kinase
MASLIEQLLDFARIDQAGGLVLEPGAMEIARAAARAAEECSLAFPTASIDIEVDGNTAGHWDEDRILQCLSNLLSNAVQHGDGRVRVHADGRGQQAISIEVSNRGRPIAPEMLPVIFDPFRRAASGFARRSGLGLGLYITKSIVEAHGGRIDVRSEDDQTTFRLELPRRQGVQSPS